MDQESKNILDFVQKKNEREFNNMSSEQRIDFYINKLQVLLTQLQNIKEAVYGRKKD
jgi:hypothetical protein